MKLAVTIMCAEHSVAPPDVDVDRSVSQLRVVAVATGEWTLAVDVFEIAIERQTLLTADGTDKM